MRKRIAKVIRRYRLHFAVITLLTYLAAIPVTLIVFPANSLWLGILILFGGLTSTVATLGDLLTDDDDPD